MREGGVSLPPGSCRWHGAWGMDFLTAVAPHRPCVRPGARPPIHSALTQLAGLHTGWFTPLKPVFSQFWRLEV